MAFPIIPLSGHVLVILIVGVYKTRTWVTNQAIALWLIRTRSLAINLALRRRLVKAIHSSVVLQAKAIPPATTTPLWATEQDQPPVTLTITSISVSIPAIRIVVPEIRYLGPGLMPLLGI